jgi:uncharacterized protein with GYD domain
MSRRKGRGGFSEHVPKSSAFGTRESGFAQVEESSISRRRNRDPSGTNFPDGAMSAKAKGTRNEHRSIRLLEEAGYQCTRAAASLGAWDIVGIGSQDVVLVQVKTRDWPGRVEMESLKQFAAPAIARKLAHRWRDRKRLPDVKEL